MVYVYSIQQAAGSSSRQQAAGSAARVRVLVRVEGRLSHFILIFLRVALFSWTHYWAKNFETSPIDCILLGIKNDIRHKTILSGTYFFFASKLEKKLSKSEVQKNILKIIKAQKQVWKIFSSTIQALFLP
jgi:hypothetical protein